MSIPSPLPAAPLIFLSYSRANRDIATQLQRELQLHGFRLWRDIPSMRAGAPDWWVEIRKAIEASDSMVLCMSLAALTSTVVSFEWNYARSKGKRVIPVFIESVFDHEDVRTGKTTVPVWMRRANWVDLRKNAPERETHWEKLLQELRTPYIPNPVYITAKAFHLPHNFVPRPREFETLVKALAVDEHPETIAVTASLRGAGGYGKTTIAKALCRDWRVAGAFPEGAYWVTLGEKLLTMNIEVRESKLVTLIIGLISEIDSNTHFPATLTLEVASELLARVLEGRRILIVIDDVWAEAHVKPFLVPGKHHAILITTRFEDAIPRGYTIIRQSVDQMDLEDAIRLLSFDVNEWNSERNWFTSVAVLLGRSAQLLGIVNSVITSHLSQGKSLHSVLGFVTKRLERYGVSAFQDNDTDEREKAFGKTLEVGIDWLKKPEQERYRLLGIFSSDMPIPVTTLGLFWELDEIVTADFCEKLEKSSLAQEWDESTLIVHDVTLKYLREQLRDTGQEETYHSKLIDAWGNPCLALLPDTYAYLNYTHHLTMAGRSAELHTLLHNYRWLRDKLNTTGIAEVLSDFANVDKDERFLLILSSLRLSAGTLAEDRSALASQLYSRLWLHCDSQQIAELRAACQQAITLLPVGQPPLDQAGGALLATFRGHLAAVTGILELADASILSWCSGYDSSDYKLCRWTIDGRVIAYFTGHTRRVVGAIALPDGTILSWSEDATLRRWLPNGEQIACFKGHAECVNGALIQIDGCLVSWSADGTLRRWNLEGEEPIHFGEQQPEVTNVLQLPDGVILSWDSRQAATDYCIRCWSATGEQLSRVLSHNDRVNGAMSLADHSILSWSMDRTLCRWQLDGTEVARFVGHTSWVTGALELTDKTILSWSIDGTLRRWKPSGQEIACFIGHSDRVTGALELADHCILSWSVDGTLRRWTHDGKAMACSIGNGYPIRGVIPLSDGTILSWSDDKLLRSWNQDAVEVSHLVGHTDSIVGARSLADGSIITWSGDKTLRCWRTDSQELAQFDRHTDAVWGLLGLSDGTVLSWSGDKTLRRWSSEGAELTRISNHTSWISGVLSLPNASIVTWSGGPFNLNFILKSWTLDGKEQARFVGHRERVNGALALPDGTLLSWSADRTLRRWLIEGEQVARFAGHREGVNGALVLQDENILSWSDDGTLRRWSMEGELVTIFEGHTSAVNGAKLLPDGTILSWSDDGTLRRWSAEGKELVRFIGHLQSVWGIKVLHEGPVLSWSPDGTLRLWTIDGREVAVLHDWDPWATDRTAALAWGWAYGVDIVPLYGVEPTLGHGHTRIRRSDRRLIAWDIETGGDISVIFYADADLSCDPIVLDDGITLVAGDASGRVLFLRDLK